MNEDKILPFTDEQIFSILGALTRGDLDSLDGLDLDQLTPEQRARLICHWLEIRSQKYIKRQAELAEWAFLKRKKGDAAAPADVVRDFLISQEFAAAITAFAAMIGLANATVQMAVAYRASRAFEMDRRQASYLQSYLSAKLGTTTDAEEIARLMPELRILANAITPARAQQILDMSDSQIQRAIPSLKSEGRAIRDHYEKPLSRVGVAIADIYPSQPWALPWNEEDLPPLPTRKPKPVSPEPGQEAGYGFPTR
ncbi:hypothetical protein [Nisaea denitrificans]|uniref:hypothetical protein n=1 Tax=Nisaea denitrificans TaxID=390877 RepID=UPI000416B642|nr:hypothetical protein [Nisaea denitrificans]